MLRAHIAPLTLALVACGAPSHPVAATASPSPAAPCASPPATGADVSADAGLPFPDLEDRKALFASLVASVRKYHLFSDLTQKNLGRRWEDDLPALEAGFVRGADEPALRDALSRFGNALHDGHLVYMPEEGARRGDHLVLPLAIEPEWVNGAARYYVAEVRDPKLRASVRAGDILRSVNGVAGDALTAAHALRSNENNWRGIAGEIAGYLTSRTTAESATKAGDEEAWVLGHRDGGEVTVKLAWKKEAWPGEEPDGHATDPEIVNIDYAPAHCSLDLPDRKYPASYRLASHGRFYCLYTSGAPPYDAYPIVRHFSVLYSGVTKLTVSPRYMLPDAGWEVSAEYFSLSRALRALHGTRGVILDLRDNIGGNDPEWFLDWYAPAPYTDLFTTVRLYADYDDAVFRDRVVNVDDDWYRWYRKASAGHPAGSDVLRPFKCLTPDCAGDNRFTPARALLDVPIALLVGPSCMSSCAHIVQIFDENDFAPLIGEPTAASYTSQRLMLPVKTRTGRDLGTIGLGLSCDSSGKTGKKLEGSTVHVDYPVESSFEGRERVDGVLVDTALRAFKEFKFPKRTSKLGP